MTLAQREQRSVRGDTASPLASALSQFDRVADYLELDPGTRAILRVSKREFIVAALRRPKALGAASIGRPRPVNRIPRAGS
jgi:hypothetical protein